jgi:hemerythrin-like domain-containing protein
MHELDRRRALLVAASGGALLAACHGKEEEKDGEVGATEDLMREHGVIRRILVVYREAAARLRSAPSSVPLEALQKAARLLRAFGEDYHERQLEEQNIFPALMKGGGELAVTVNTLAAQHQRGREITEYVLTLSTAPIAAAAAEPLARTLEAFARMYELHAAIEDTVVFPAWKKGLSAKQLDAIGDRFEDIERAALGKDGFEGAVAQIADVERALGIDLTVLTAPRP